MAVKRRLMIPLTQSHFCCCSPTLSLRSAEVVMKRFTRPYSRESHRAADGAGFGGRAFCWCCYSFITAVRNPFILNFHLNAGLISTVHAWAVRPLSPILTIFLAVALQCLAGCVCTPSSLSIGGAWDLRHPRISVFLFLNCSSVPLLSFCSSFLLCPTLSSLLP